MISNEDYAKLIAPWQAFYDETYKRNYFYNTETQESVWALPQEVNDRIQEYYEDQLGEVFEETNNVAKYVPASERMSKDNSEVLKRPARKQVEQSIAKSFAYQQGDEEYNIWYDKYQSEKRDKEREAAPTRCEPEVDAGYTKADKMEKFSAYFCFHFARGCCAEGANCKYYHRIPTFEECDQIDQAKDIFGRPRFSTHREDMDGIGSFLKDTRTIGVTDFKMPGGNDPIASMYEILWRHFSPWGDIEDINLHPGKGTAYIKYAHRCMAEFAKFAMQNQALDSDEILVIKWVAEEGDEDEKKAGEKGKKGDKKKRRRPQKEQTEKKTYQEETFEAGYGKEGELNLDNEEEQILKHRKKEIESSVNMMSEVLKRIEQRNQGAGDDEDAFDENGNLKVDENKDGTHGEGQKGVYYHPSYGYVNPESNNAPLF